MGVAVRVVSVVKRSLSPLGTGKRAARVEDLPTHVHSKKRPETHITPSLPHPHPHAGTLGSAGTSASSCLARRRPRGVGRARRVCGSLCAPRVEREGRRKGFVALVYAPASLTPTPTAHVHHRHHHHHSKA